MSNKLSISISNDNVALVHDRREYCPPNVHKELMNNNVYITCCSNLEKVFNEIFEKDVEEYNLGKRSDRMISNYYQKISSHQDREKSPKPAYEYVIQFGSKENNNVLDPEFKQVNEDTRDMLIELVKIFKKKYPNFIVISAVIHMDECTPHLHIVFVPVGTGYKNGMKHQCSLTKALQNMGYKNRLEIVDGKKVTVFAITEWQNDVKDVMTDIMEEYGYEREYMNNTDKHMSMSNFKYKCAMEELDKVLDDRIEEVEYLGDKIDNMRTVIQSLREEKNELTDQVNDLTDQVNGLTEKRNSLLEEIECLRVGRNVLLEQKKKELKEESDRELTRCKHELEEEYRSKEADLMTKVAELAEGISECEKLLNELKDVKAKEEYSAKINRLKNRFDNSKLDLQFDTATRNKFDKYKSH